jgi:hypothetical protein
MLKRMHALPAPLLAAALVMLVMVLFSVRMDATAQSTNQDPSITWLFNAKANSDNTQYGQHEPDLAISRTDPNVVVAIAKDYREGNVKHVWIYVSQDGGHTWPADLQLHMPGLPTDVPNQSDPVTMARDDGRIYAECLGYDASGGNGHGIFITWTDDSGNTWQNPSIVVTHNQTQGLDDKDWFAIDNYPTSPYYHNMYVAWANGGILFKRSTDGGQNWSTNILNIAPGNTEYPYPVVGPDGALYVFYMDGWGAGVHGYIRFVKSTNGGTSFTGPYTVTATSQPDSPVHGGRGYDQWRFFSIITAAVNPTNANDIWVGWTDDNGVYDGRTDVLYVHSTDGGSTWSAHARLSHDDPDVNDHITPVFSMSLDGRLHAFWLDRRADPNNILFHGYHTSTKDGITWETDTQVSEQPFDLNIGFPPGSGNAAGDYWGLDTVGNTVMAAWNTTINGNQDIYVAGGIYSTTLVTLTGQVVDAQSLLPLSGAEVALNTGNFTTTNDTGFYTMTVEAGVYTATASSAGYFPQVVPDLLLWSGTVVQNFSLQPEVTLTGLVSDITTNTPITGAQVNVDTGAFTYTNAGGIYTLMLAPGIYTATASAEGYLPVTVTGIKLISNTVTQDFSLRPVICPVPIILKVNVNIIDPLTLSFSPTVTSTLPVDYLWSFGDGFVSNDQTPVHTYPDYGTYTVTLDASNACGSASWNRTLELDRFIFLPLITRVNP